MGLLDIVTDTLDALSNIAFIIQLTVCLWIVIASICARSIYARKGLIANLKHLCDSTVKARLGGNLTDCKFHLQLSTCGIEEERCRDGTF